MPEVQESEVSNYGHSSSTSKIQNSVSSVNTAIAPYASSALKTSENPFYDMMQRAHKVSAIASVVSGDYYAINAAQKYNNMNFSGIGDANAEYLKKIGCSNSQTQYQMTTDSGTIVEKSASDFSSKDFATLRANGSVTVNGVTYTVDKNSFNRAVEQSYHQQAHTQQITNAIGKTDQVKAMQSIYSAGLESMKKSNNLVVISEASKKGADAVRRECAKVQGQLSRDISSLAANSSNKSFIEKTLQQGQLTETELNNFNRIINSDKLLTSAQKNQLKQAMADANEIQGFIKSGAIAGGCVDKSSGQIKYGKRLLMNGVLGQEMTTGIDSARMFYNVTKAGAKTAFALGRAGGFVGGAAGNLLATPGAKVADTIASKVTGTQKDTASNFLKHAQEKRKKNYADRKEARKAKRTGRYKEYKAKKRAEMFNNKERDLDALIKRNQSKLSEARKQGNKNAIERRNRKNDKLNKKKDALLRKRERRNKRDKFMGKLNGKIDSFVKKLLKPLDIITSPLRAVKAFFNFLKGLLLKYIILPIAAVVVGIPCAVGLVLILVGAAESVNIFSIHYQEQKELAATGYPAEVEQWRAYVTDRCNFYNDTIKDQDLTLYVNWILAMIWQESGGNPNVLSAEHPYNSGNHVPGDVFQSIESGLWENGTPDNWDSMTNQQKSIDAGVREFINNLKLWKPEGPSDMDTMMLLIQGYNYGADGWHSYCKKNNITKWSLVESTKYSLLQAAQPGWKYSTYGTPNHAELVRDKYQSAGSGTAGSGAIVEIAGARGVIETATNQIGIKEDPPGSNAVLFNTWFYGKPVQGKDVPWCCAFVTWVFYQSGNSAAIGNVHTAGCSELQRQAAAGTGGMIGFTDIKKVVPGDIVIFRNGGHVGIVVDVNKDGTLITIEGNTSGVGYDADGGCVAKKTQEAGTYYIHPNYKAAIKEMQKKNKKAEKAEKKAEKEAKKQESTTEAQTQ